MSNYLYKNAYGSRWLRVFYHKTTDGSVIFTVDEAIHCNLPNKYSILDEISSKMRYSGKFEFLLEYPTNHPNKYIRWKQSLNPLNDIEISGSNSATGFQLIHSDWSSFKGLVRTTINNEANCVATLLDGNPGTIQWYYSIGMTSYCDYIYNKKYPPGPTDGVEEIILWIRIYSSLKHFSCRSSSHFNMYLFVTLVLS